MWKRRKFRECADEELEMIGRDFRDAYTNKRVDQQSREKILKESSEKGIAILRMLALSICSEQDFGSLPSICTTVGALNRFTNTNEVSATLNNYRPLYSEKIGFEPLSLREALSKIA
ncbi:MAG: hypothetical protein AAF609_09410 [Cyanobacteria bacterium P01_C01_bin.120]